MDRCVSGKRIYASMDLAEDALIEAWIRYDYRTNNGPVAVYKCEDCGRFHLTSRGPMNERLAAGLKDGTIGRQKEAERWTDKFKRR